MNDNITNFETTADNKEIQTKKEELNNSTPQEVSGMDRKNVSKVLQLIDKNKEVGIEQMQRSVNGQEGRPLLQGRGTEDTIRTIEKGIQGALTSVEAINSLVDMLRHDIIAAVQSLQQIQQAVIMTSTQVGVLMEVLKEKNLITEKEMEETFKKIAKEQSSMVHK